MSMLPPGTAAMLASTGPFCTDEFAEGKEGIDWFTQARVLVIGAGGLGCELVKSLALSGVKNIDVIDMDTIDVSNLNRQFLFRKNDVGKYKSEVAAAFIKRRVPSCNITAHTCKIQEKNDEFYKQFNVVIGGLDSVTARLWISEKLCQIAYMDEMCIPYIDGGSEAWKGHVKVIYPGQTACMHCQQELFPPPVVFQFCTIANTPRQPEHCVAYAKDIWGNSHTEPLDGDNDEHIKWIVETAIEHGKKFGLSGIDERMARGVVKNIIPAIASTQAIVASMCTTEAIKILTGAGPTIDNNMLMNGANGFSGNLFHFGRLENCEACSHRVEELPRIPGETLGQLRERLGRDFNCPEASLVMGDGNGGIKKLYMTVFANTHGNLNKPVDELIPDESIVTAQTFSAKPDASGRTDLKLEFFLTKPE